MVNLVFIISIILLVIILLSAINVCSNSVYYNRFIDRYYSYISEPFTITTKSIDRMSKIKMNEQKINNIKNAISTLETKLNSIN